MSVSVTMAFKGTVLYAVVRAQILPGQIKPRDQVQFKLKHGSNTTHPRIRTNERTTLLTCQNLLAGHK